MKNKFVYICVAHRETPSGVIVLRSDKVDLVPSHVVTDLLEHDLVGTNWLPYVVNSLSLIPNTKIIAITDYKPEYLDIIHQQIKKQL